VGKNFAFGKFADAFFEMKLFVVELEIQKILGLAVATSYFPSANRKEGQLVDLNMMKASGKVTGGAVYAGCGTPHVHWQVACF
jgi:hypothetical protein